MAGTPKKPVKAAIGGAHMNQANYDQQKQLLIEHAERLWDQQEEWMKSQSTEEGRHAHKTLYPILEKPKDSQPTEGGRHAHKPLYPLIEKPKDDEKREIQRERFVSYHQSIWWWMINTARQADMWVIRARFNNQDPTFYGSGIFTVWQRGDLQEADGESEEDRVARLRRKAELFIQQGHAQLPTQFPSQPSFQGPDHLQKFYKNYRLARKLVMERIIGDNDEPVWSKYLSDMSRYHRAHANCHTTVVESLYIKDPGLITTPSEVGIFLSESRRALDLQHVVVRHERWQQQKLIFALVETADTKNYENMQPKFETYAKLEFSVQTKPGTQAQTIVFHCMIADPLQLAGGDWEQRGYLKRYGSFKVTYKGELE
ncbi:hypothetical protein F4778DRAFT_719062 [Xylariomycetidae sp. FL2044]|nr:hypothetical protein F4778DRAFT_719062 [Xylariomycetidae sp. FL2044]